MKTLLIPVAALIAAFTVPMPSHANGPEQHLRNFATCAGRLSAVMEFQWMFDGPASEQTKAQRTAVLDLIGAIMEPGQDRTVLHWRLSAKHAQAVLLTRATFNDDPDDAAWAYAQAARLTQECTGLLLS